MRYALPAFCSFVFAACDHQVDRITGKRKAVPRRLCREDCELMKYDVCREENINSKHDAFLRVSSRLHGLICPTFMAESVPGAT